MDDRPRRQAAALVPLCRLAGRREQDKDHQLLKEQPYNTNQLAEAMGLDYKAIQHHMSVLEKNNMVAKTGEKYGVLYFISNYLEHNIEALEEVRAAIEKKAKKNLSRSGKK